MRTVQCAFLAFTRVCNGEAENDFLTFHEKVRV